LWSLFIVVLLSSLCRNTSIHFIFEATVVVTTNDSKESFFAKVNIPRIGRDPVFYSILNSPPKNLHSVATELVSPSVLVDTTFVREEICVNSEGSFNRSILINFLHDGSLSSIDVVHIRGLMKIGTPRRS